MSQSNRNVLSSSMCVHTFSLNPTLGNGQTRSSICVDFTPIDDLQGMATEVRPEFNFDHSAFTPAFILPIEKDVQAYTLKIEVQSFRHFQQTHRQQQNVLFIAKPVSNYCYVCKQYYSEYIKHINHKVHKKNLKNSQINECIDMLINSLKSKTHRSQKRKLNVVNLVCEQEKPKKKRIIQNAVTLAPEAIKLVKYASQSTNINNSQVL